MSRQLIARTVVRCYPAEVRQALGGELVGTLLDAGDTSTMAFLANAASLVRSGLWARARQELGRPIGQLLIGAVCWAAVLMAMSEVVEGVGTGVFWGGSIFSFGNDPETVIDMYLLPVMILALFTTGHNRTTGLLGLLRVAMRLHQSPLISLADFMILVPVQALGFGWLALRPASIRPAGRYLWPLPAAMWAFYWLTLLGQHSGIGRMTPVLAALLLLPLAPSLALGLGIDWLLNGVWYLTYPGGDGYPLWTTEFLACLPILVLAFGIYRNAATSVTQADQT